MRCNLEITFIMDHNISQFREIIEDCIDEDNSVFQEQEKLKALLEVLPEEDTDHVKAYRSLMFLVDYLESHDHEKQEHFSDPDPVHQLLRLRPKIEDRAIDNITDRLVVKKDGGDPFGSVDTKTLKDPVSKGQQRISNAAGVGGEVDARTHHLARSILEAPL